MRKLKFLFLYFIVLVLITGTGYSAFAQIGASPELELPQVVSIEVKGLKRIEEGAIKSRITQKIGEPLSKDKTTEDIKAIFKMGYFDDVKVEFEPFEGGIKLVYLIKEKPIIIRLDFQGNKEIEDSTLKEKITIKQNSIADTVLIQDNADKLRSYYEEQGYWLAKVIPVVKKVSEDEVSLTYQIEEGSKVRIKKIVIEGNKAISEKKIRKVMETDDWWIFSFITSVGYYKKETMAADIEKIKNLYFDNGYIKATVADPKIELTEDKSKMVITIMVSEGEQYKISSVDITGNKAFPDDQIRKKIKSVPASVLSKSKLRDDIAALTEMYSEKGYALVTIDPDIAPDDASKQVKVTFKINEGDVFRVGRIEISGNVKTRDKVIRREVRLDEGDIFNGTLLKRSYERINNLNFFDTVDIQPKPRLEEKIVDVGIKVKERPTGFISVGGGYSSVDKFIATADITQGNLFGKGQYIKLRGELGGRSSFYELAFRDPWFMDKPISLSTGIYRTTREYSGYDKKAFGFYVGLGKSIGEYWKGDITYNFEKASIENFITTEKICLTDLNSDGDCDDPGDVQRTIEHEYLEQQKGTRTTSSITTSVARDTRDNYLDPTRGSRNALSLTFAGLGGNAAFIRGVVDSGWYLPVGKTTTTFMLRGRLGYATGILGKELPIYERFYVGGMYTIRGLGFGEAGPRGTKKITDTTVGGGTTTTTKPGDYIGGTTELIFNAEYIFPIFPEVKFKGVVFFDAGNAYEKFNDLGNFRYTSGAGIRWISPIGPFRIEWGYNLNKKPGESSSKIEFAFGSFF